MNSIEQEIANSIQAMETGESRYIEGRRIVTQSEIDLAEMEAQQAVEAQQASPEMMSEGQAIIPQLEGEPQPIPGTEQGPQAFGGVEDQMNIDAIAGPVDNMGVGEFLETTGQVFGGAIGGAATATLGLPGDVVGIVEGIVQAAKAPEGEGLDAFLQGMGRVSEMYGSAATTKMLYDFVDKLDITDEAKEQIKAGSALLGEWGEIPGVAVAAKAFMSSVEGLSSYAAGAQGRITERGMTLQSGLDPLAAVDEAIVAGQSLIPSVRGIKPGDELLVQHNLRPESLSDIEMLGGLPVPSLAIVKSSTPLKDFGSITLIGTPDMAKPSARNPVYSSDAYTRRRPNIEDQNGRPVFFNKKTWKDQTATLKNMVSAMKGGPGEESVGATAGSLRAIASKPFRSIAEVKKSRDRIVSSKDMESVKDEIDRQYIGLIRSVGEDLDDIYLSLRNSGLDTSEIMRGLIRGTLRDEDVLSRLSPDTKERIDIFREFASELPTEYFEINPQRAVGLDEFKAALVPESLPEDQIKILERSGVQEIIKYTDEADRQKKIKSMRDVMFTIGAAAVAGEQAISEMTGDQADITVTYPNEGVQ